MKKRFLISIALASFALQGCGDKSDTQDEPTISMNNFAGRWVCDQNEEQSKVIDLSSDGNYVYEIRGGTGGKGDVHRSTPGTYEITPEGNIRSLERLPGSPDWTGTRKGNVIEFSLNGGEPLAFTPTGKPPESESSEDEVIPTEE